MVCTTLPKDVSGLKSPGLETVSCLGTVAASAPHFVVFHNGGPSNLDLELWARKTRAEPLNPLAIPFCVPKSKREEKACQDCLTTFPSAGAKTLLGEVRGT